MEKQVEEEEAKTRIYVGGLGEKVTRDDLSNIFSSLGSVESVEIVRTKGRSFAYLDFSPSNPKSLSKLFSAYNGCAWKGGRLRLEKAKEHYLARLNRELAEDEDAPLSTHKYVNPTATQPNKVLESKNKTVQIFFPRLCKVKSLPFSGTGKHKYSFQRIEAPPLPMHFCDCEEHSVPYDTVEGKQIHNHTAEQKGILNVEAHNDVINEEELNLMNSVMKRLFERENVSNATRRRSETELATGEPNSFKFIEDLQVADEDNLMTNVVSRKINGTTLSRLQEKSTQKLASSGTQTSKNKSARNVLKEPNMNISPLAKKRKSLVNEESIENEAVTIKPVGDVNMQIHPNKSRKLLRAQPAETQSDIKQSNTNHSWSQKMSWRTLVGDKDSSVFSVSNILPASTSTKEVDSPLESIQGMQFDENEVDEDDLIVNVVSKKNNRMTRPEIQEQEKVPTASQKTTFNETQTSTDRHAQSVPKVQEKSIGPNKEMKSLLNRESDKIELTFASPDVDGRLQTDTAKSGMPTEAQPDEPESHVKQSVSDHPQSQSLSSKKCVGDKGNDSSSILNVSQYISAKEGQSLSDSPDVPDSTDGQNGSLVRQETLENKPAKIKIVEVPAEVQPTKNDTASNKTSIGLSWFQKSSWTHMVTENNSSFSIRQISPNITFEKQEVTIPNMGKDVENLEERNFNNAVMQDTKEHTRNNSTALEVEKYGGLAKRLSDQNKQTVSGNGETSALIVENESDSMLRQTSNRDVSIGETCSFMRNAASIKEWAKTKAALSGSDKRKSIQK